MKSFSCPNSQCPVKAASGKIIGHGFYRTTWENVVDTSARPVGKCSDRTPVSLTDARLNCDVLFFPKRKGDKTMTGILQSRGRSER
jgi:hypothetical protein